MKRAQLIELLKRYQPAWPEEVAAKQKMLEFIQANEQCFERTLEAGHMTASCWLTSKDGSKALLMYHTKLNAWLQLGGHCDGDHDLLRVAIKEAQEESGIMHIVPVQADIFDIDIHRIPEHKGVKSHLHYDVRFLLRVASDEQPVQNSESKELRWIEKDIQHLPACDESVKRLFYKWTQVSLNEVAQRVSPYFDC